MNSKRILFKVVLDFLLACVLIGLILAGIFVYWLQSWGHYSSFGLDISKAKDQQLIAIFHAHREAFEKLQQMATEDLQYGWSFSSPSFEGAELDEKYRQEYETNPIYSWYFKSPYFEGGKLKKARRKEYEDLVSGISSNLEVDTHYDGSMAFTFAGGGTSAIGPNWSKSIKYVPLSHESKGAVYGIWEENGTNYQQWHGIVLTNLDNAQSLPADTAYVRQIEPNWFLFYERDE